jgi:hypothetical protein
MTALRARAPLFAVRMETHMPSREGTELFCAFMAEQPHLERVSKSMLN